ncbi:hypothetical protein CALCODRAFT_152255 [Calocera cornea HHB12733]|uniref:Uncharacterized protein n=1 Tax=Calocera cornea HHB12733 TaxID=1353952 RepID=A0A165CNP4_9BASI|nr:hypothetical protein CALCODRAFT_152255 [Calocera cornea HHB12733]
MTVHDIELRDQSTFDLEVKRLCTTSWRHGKRRIEEEILEEIPSLHNLDTILWHNIHRDLGFRGFHRANARFTGVEVNGGGGRGRSLDNNRRISPQYGRLLGSRVCRGWENRWLSPFARTLNGLMFCLALGRCRRPVGKRRMLDACGSRRRSPRRLFRQQSRRVRTDRQGGGGGGGGSSSSSRVIRLVHNSMGAAHTCCMP